MGIFSLTLQDKLLSYKSSLYQKRRKEKEKEGKNITVIDSVCCMLRVYDESLGAQFLTTK